MMTAFTLAQMPLVNIKENNSVFSLMDDKKLGKENTVSWEFRVFGLAQMEMY